MNGRIEVKDATGPIFFEITDKDISSVNRRKDPEKCVIAQAIRHSLPQVVNVYACASITILTIIKSGKLLKVRYQTSSELRRGLNNWDIGMNWNLPAGRYRLLPPCPSRKRSVVAERSKNRRKQGKDLRHNRDGKSYQATGRCKGVPLNPRRIAILEANGNRSR